MISRPIKEGFRGVTRHWGMSISSAIAVTITLIIISLFLILSFNIQNFTKNIESSVEISVQIDRESEDREDEIEAAIRAIEGVEDVVFYSKDEEFQFYLDSLTSQEIREVFEPFGEDNPMLDSFYVTTTSGDMITEVSAQIEEIEGVAEDGVSYGGQSTKLLISAMGSIRRIGSIVVIALTLLAIFLIQNTIKLTISARQDEITIMRNVGATNNFIRSPFVIEGIITAMIGAIVPIILTIYGYRFIYNWTGGILISNMFKLVEPEPFVFELSVILLLIGIVVGLMGSWMSVTRYLRWKR